MSETKETLDATIRRRVQAMKENRQNFERVFGVRFLDYFPSAILGLDITKLDKDVIKSRKKTVEAAILSKFGPQALEMVKELL